MAKNTYCNKLNVKIGVIKEGECKTFFTICVYKHHKLLHNTIFMHLIISRSWHDTQKIYNRYNYNYTLFSYNRYYYNYFKTNHSIYNYKYRIILIDTS